MPCLMNNHKLSRFNRTHVQSHYLLIHLFCLERTEARPCRLRTQQASPLCARHHVLSGIPRGGPRGLSS
jgi:hypothetical protein